MAPDTLWSVSAFRAALLALSAAALTGACAAGQHAATAFEKPSIDGTQGRVGSIQLQGVALQAPTSPAYDSGADVALKLYIVNDGHSADALTNVASPAFVEGWDVVASGSPSGSSPSSSASVPGFPPTSSPAPPTSSAAPPTSSAASPTSSAASPTSSAASPTSRAASPTSSPAPPTSSAASVPTTGAPQQIGAGAALGLSLTDLTPDGGASTDTLVLKGLANSSSPLYPGTTVNITFTFAKAGQTTLSVPVQITANPNTATLPGAATSPA